MINEGIAPEPCNMEEIELQDPVTLDLTTEDYYSDQMITKYGKEVKIKLKYMAGYYPGCYPGEIFFEGIICEDGETVFIPGRNFIKENIICEDKDNKPLVKFTYNTYHYKGYLDHIDNSIYYIIGEDNLLYKVKKLDE